MKEICNCACCLNLIEEIKKIKNKVYGGANIRLLESLIHTVTKHERQTEHAKSYQKKGKQHEMI